MSAKPEANWKLETHDIAHHSCPQNSNRRELKTVICMCAKKYEKRKKGKEKAKKVLTMQTIKIRGEHKLVCIYILA
jgi:hypothetical protein